MPTDLSIHHLQGQLLAMQCIVTALLHSMPPAIRREVEEALQLQADRARVHIISTRWQGQVMPGFEEQLERATG